MKIQSIPIITLILLFVGSLSMAQCDYKVRVSEKVKEGKGEISVILQNSSDYVCILYSYTNGVKSKYEEVGGSNNRIEFDNLPIDRYFRVEFSFKVNNSPLCNNWVSELIQFND